MPVRTRILLAVITIFVGVLVVYYGFVMPEDAPPAGPEPARLGDEPSMTGAATEAPAAATDDAAADNDANGVSDGGQDVRRDVRTSSESLPVLPRDQPALPAPALDTAPPPRSETPAVLGAPPGGGPSPRAGRELTPRTADPAPSAAPDLAPAPAPQYTMYTVDDGDTMSSIAEWWFGDESKWDLIAKLNLVDPQRLQIGQQLRLPPRDGRRSPVERTGGDAVHEVRPGDTLTSISRAFYGTEASWTLIYDANRALIGPDADALEVGMKLRIP